MKLPHIIDNWPKTMALLVLTALLFWGYGCPPKTRSLTKPDTLITRPELQVELDQIIATARIRMADLDKQEAFRDIIFKNAMLIVETGTLNPAGIITLLCGLYGITRGVKDVKDRIKKPTP